MDHMQPYQIPKKLVTMDVSERLNQNFSIKTRLGKNGCEDLYVGQSTASNEEVIIKRTPNIFFKNGIDSLPMIIDAINCASVMKEHSHDNIVQFYDIGIDPNTKEFYEVVEYCKEGHIQALNIDQGEILEIIQQVASGLSLLHYHNITHRNIKPENILIKTVENKKIYKITDVGICSIKDFMQQETSTRPYIAPEFFNGQEISNKIDIWALGITIHYLLFECYPFAINSIKSLAELLRKEQYEYPSQLAANKGLVPQMKDLLENMLKKEPSQRSTAREIIASVDAIRKLHPQFEILSPVSRKTDTKFRRMSEAAHAVNKKKTEEKHRKMSEVVLTPNQSLYPCFRMISKPIPISSAKLNHSVCLAGRGLTQTASKNNGTIFSIDESGTVCKIDGNNNKIILKKSFDVGGSSKTLFGLGRNSYDARNEWCSAVLNKSDNYLLVSGCMNSNLYLVDPSNLEILFTWKQTHSATLNRVIFLDNEMFCAGYNDGVAKLFKINTEKEIASLNTGKNLNFGVNKFQLGGRAIKSFGHEDFSKELLVGNDHGRLISIYCDTFNAVNWDAKIHSDWLNCICKSQKHILTGSADKTIALMNDMSPPELIKKFQIDSSVYQLFFTPGENNLLVLTNSKLVLFKNDNYTFKKCNERSHENEFEGNGLQSFIVLTNYSIIIGDFGGYIYSVKLLEQLQILNQQCKYYHACK